MDETRKAAWDKALRFAALPGAHAVIFGWERTAEGTRFSLKSRDADGAPIGDGRDYDLLKAAMRPLERLAEAEGFAAAGVLRQALLDLETGVLAIG